MKSKTFGVPVLFIIFKRKDTALQVIDAIAKIKPEKLYISQDGPRSKKEEKDILETRKAVLSKVNWDCKLTVWIHKKNLGLRKHIPQAFDNLFKEEEYGIYLEDDTVPSEDFFYFQKKMLERYKNDSRIFYIEGTNLYPNLMRSKDSCFLTQLGNVWGFGIWKRSWKLYDHNLEDLNNLTYEKLKDYIFDKKYVVYLKTFLSAIKKGNLDSWAYQLDYPAAKNKMFFIEPAVNLVNNIGINKGTNPFLQEYESNINLSLPSRYPQKIDYLDDNKKRDVLHFENLFKYFMPRIFLINIYLNLPKRIKLFITKCISLIMTRDQSR